MSYNDKFALWQGTVTDPELLSELQQIKDNPSEIENRFFADLEFGTGGLRGKLGAGTFYMNRHTVGQAAQGIANYMKAKGFKSVVIGFDSRIKSDFFAQLSAEIFSANGITAHLFANLIPTPVVSFAVRHLHADAGIMITASHNPKQYNGYKVYNGTGCQIANEDADEIYAQIKAVDMFKDVKTDKNQSLIKTISNDVYSAYINAVLSAKVLPIEQNDFKILYTPLCGTGNRPVRDVLKAAGFNNVKVVGSEEKPDGTFATCPYPNPEFKEAYNEAFKEAQQFKPDLIIATDPDADRIGIAVKRATKASAKGAKVEEESEYVLMTGNEVGLMLLEFILGNKAHTSDSVVVKTIVSTALTYTIAKKRDIKIVDTLTGFKYIGEYLNGLEAEGKEDRYLLGFEESYGYLIGTHARDKDAMAAALLLAEMAYSAAKDGKTLIDIMEQIYADYGYIGNKTLNFAFEGAKGKAEMGAILDYLRRTEVASFDGMHVASRTDFLNDDTGLPSSDVIRYSLTSGEVIIRPSGTEPKMKAYLTAITSHPETTAAMLSRLEKSVNDLIAKARG